MDSDDRCRHCGRRRWDHTGIGGVLLCGTEFEAEPPTCAFCEMGWPTVKLDRRKHQDQCRIDQTRAHVRPEEPTREEPGVVGAAIKPALTPEQWANSYTDEEGVCVDGRLWFAHGGPPESLHAIGAVCLDGKPFGFTREMVVALRDALACSGTVSSPDNLPLAEQAVDAMEALLRPEDV